MSGFRLEEPYLRGLALDRRDGYAQQVQVGNKLRGAGVVSGKESSDRLVVVRVDLLDDLQVAVERREIEAVEFGVEVHALDAVDGVERLDGMAGVHVEYVEGRRAAIDDEQTMRRFIERECDGLSGGGQLEPREDLIACAVYDAYLT